MRSITILIILSTLPFIAYPQVSNVNSLNPRQLNWHNLDLEKDQILGTSVDRVYSELINGIAAKKVITVAVIDSGVDIVHEDLEGKIWINPNEIPGNGIDDDQNGYIDDIHGWNFIGNSDGTNMFYENMEITRLVRKYDKKYRQMPNASSLPPEEVPAFELYKKAKQEHSALLKHHTTEKDNLSKFVLRWEASKSIVKKATGSDEIDLNVLMSFEPETQRQRAAKEFLFSRYNRGFTEKNLINILTNNATYLDYYLNVDFVSRELIGDDPYDIEDRDYGNPDVKGPRSDHGSGVSGIIAANRENGIGINGIAESVNIMALRVVPKGDERDKDIALAIRYAADNGAQIINMSFGKTQSPEKRFIDDAVRYAQEKGVLLIHGSGNDGINIDETPRYPSDYFIDGEQAELWIQVGATGMSVDNDLVAVFSNYGVEHVDLFAPGVDMISLDSASTYSQHSGTSLSAPVVSGIAALIWSYHPEFTANDIKEVLFKSVYTTKKKIFIPGTGQEKRKKSRLSDLSVTGGIVNAYAAFKAAQSLAQTKPK